MHELHFISDVQLKAAQEAPLVARQLLPESTAHAEYAAEGLAELAQRRIIRHVIQLRRRV